MSSQDFLKPKLLVKVKELVKCSLQNEVLFEPPRVKIIFASGITKGLHRKICKVNLNIYFRNWETIYIC